jgi:formamidopyrimidine-DNA glycosylase
VVPAAELAPAAWDRILDAARSIARASQAAGGVTLADEGWVDLWGRPGRYAGQLRVHARDTCATCGQPTRSAVVGGRSARWCPRCQPARRRR